MEDFLNRLYSYEYFGTYLMISIAVLILLFVIILFFGKKDQKNREIEETKKLQQIKSEDAFKEEENLSKVEVEDIKEPVKEENPSVNEPVIVPSIEEEPLVSEVDTLPNIPTANEIENLTTSIETVSELENNNLEKPILNAIPNIEEEKVSEGPVLEPEEELPLVFDSSDAPQIPEFNLDEIISSTVDTNNIEPAKEEIDSLTMEMPKIEEAPKPKEVFSSVFVEETPKEEVKEIKKDDEEDFELPTLKKEKVEVPEEIELPNLNDLSGESYNIK